MDNWIIIISPINRKLDDWFGNVSHLFRLLPILHQIKQSRTFSKSSGWANILDDYPYLLIKGSSLTALSTGQNDCVMCCSNEITKVNYCFVTFSSGIATSQCIQRYSKGWLLDYKHYISSNDIRVLVNFMKYKNMNDWNLNFRSCKYSMMVCLTLKSSIQLCINHLKIFTIELDI